MAGETHEVAKGDGFAVGNLDSIGEGPGFRKVRRELEVAELGVLVMLVTGAKGGYVGRDGRLPEGEDPRVRRPGESA